MFRPFLACNAIIQNNFVPGGDYHEYSRVSNNLILHSTMKISGYQVV